MDVPTRQSPQTSAPSCEWWVPRPAGILIDENNESRRVELNRLKRHLSATLGMLSIALSACGGAISEVRTNSGGVLDCPSDTVRYTVIDPAPGNAAPTPDDARSRLAEALVPPGTPQLGSESPVRAVYVYIDEDEHRVGRVIVHNRSDDKWFATEIERCG
jgi:hypothetical protein